ncbi:hypothetical protein KCP78_01010 [Salmonella enterica subsp. enterica]|nr:hypothetical protein KCP78_01010 [Salmonella enterica subsp. enterica]
MSSRACASFYNPWPDAISSGVPRREVIIFNDGQFNRRCNQITERLRQLCCARWN